MELFVAERITDLLLCFNINPDAMEMCLLGLVLNATLAEVEWMSIKDTTLASLNAITTYANGVPSVHKAINSKCTSNSHCSTR